MQIMYVCMYVCICEGHTCRCVGVNRPKYAVCMCVSITGIKVFVKLKISPSVNVSQQDVVRPNDVGETRNRWCHLTPPSVPVVRLCFLYVKLGSAYNNQ